MRIHNYINGIEGVATGGVAVANVPVNRRYFDFRMFVTGNLAGGGASQTAEQLITNVRVYVNSVVIIDLTAAELRKIALLNGLTLTDEQIPIFAAEPWRATVTGEESISWDLFGQQKCTIELTFASGTENLTFKMNASFDYGRNVSVNDKGETQPLLAIVKKTANTYNAGSGQFDITTLPQRWPIQRIELQASAGTISFLECYRDDEKVHEATVAENNAILTNQAMDGSQFSYVLAFDSDQQVSSALQVNKTLLVRPTFSAANQCRVITEHRSNGYV